LNDLGKRFRELRKQRGLTSTALAQPKYSVSYVSQIERGQRNPSQLALEYFAWRLRVSPRYLATGVPDDVEVWLKYEIEAARRELKEGRAEEAEQRICTVLEKADQYPAARARATALPILGEILMRLPNRVPEAIEALEDALREELTDREAGMVTARLGMAYRAAGDLRHAVELVEGFLGREFEVALDPVVLTELHTVLVNVRSERGEPVQAERAAARALASVDDLMPPDVRANAYWSASQAFARNGRWEAALQLADRATLLMESIEDRARVAYLHTASAYLCLQAQPPRVDEAGEHLDAAEMILSAFDLPADMARVHTEKSRLALLQDQPSEAVTHAEHALSRAASGSLERAEALLLKGRALARLKNATEARAAFREAIELFGRSGSRQQQAACLREIGELELASGDLKAAVKVFHEGLEVLSPPP
jgi:tetratricopeptide (TPR) repeat protein